MADDVQRLLLQIDASATLLRQEVAKARTDIDGFADRTERKLGGINKSFDSIGGAAGKATAKIAGMATALLSVGQAASFMVRANADMQRLSAMMEVATGSTQKAGAAMADLQKFAAETPFTLNQVVEGFIRLKNLGLDPSIETMRSFGNTASAMGKDVMQFIEAVADAATGEFERLKEFGIKASKEGDNVKFTFQGVTTTVRNSADAITAYLKGLGDESGVFAGSMAKQMDTIDGKLSNLEDAASRFATALGALGFNNLFMSQLDKATRGMEYLERVARGLANIRQTEGVGAMMTASFDEAAMSADPRGMRNRLIRQANDARTARIAAERRQAGMFPMSGLAFSNFQKAEQLAERRLAQFEARNAGALALGGFENMIPGYGGASPNPSPSPASKAGRTSKRTGGTSRASDFVDPSMRAGWALGMADSAEMQLQNEALQGIAQTMKELAQYDFELDLIDRQQIELAQDYTRTLTEGLAQAVVYGRNFGDVLKGLAQQILSSGLINILSGGKFGTSFGDSLGALGSIFGGFRAKGGPVSLGKAYVVGERGPELFIPKASGFINPNASGGGNQSGGTSDVRVTVEPSPLFITTVAQATQAASADAMRRANRPRMMASPGA
jgi:hypothetical protein